MKDSKSLIGYVPYEKATFKTYQKLGFKCGLEIHQQLRTKKKLFCNCPAKIYHHFDDFDAEIVRHMRPTLSELGEYDGTALMEFKTKKKIIYRINNLTACTYELDDTPPYLINKEALKYSLEMALMLKLNIVGELHITRKQYLDGSIPTGFQRTAIVGINGKIPLANKEVKIRQLSIEEDSCREVIDFEHIRIYSTDRLGIPLIETVTDPDLLTPDEAKEAAHYIRFLARSAGHVNVGIGSGRQDVNVSITGGTRIEIKGVAHISWIPKLTHNEAFRQKALLKIKEILNKRLTEADIAKWQIETYLVNYKDTPPGRKAFFIHLPSFEGILSFFTSPGKTFANEISDRLKVVACLEQPNMLILDGDNSEFLLFTTDIDYKTAIDTITERCLEAFKGVPNETRKANKDGTTQFERVLPGPDRMYPDTDSAPIPLAESDLLEAKNYLPVDLHDRYRQLKKWNVSKDVYHFILRNNLMPTLEKIFKKFAFSPKYIATLMGHLFKNINIKDAALKLEKLCQFVFERKLHPNIIKDMAGEMFIKKTDNFEEMLKAVGYKKQDLDKIILKLKSFLPKAKTITNPRARLKWIMGRLHKEVIGNVSFKDIYLEIKKHECA